MNHFLFALVAAIGMFSAILAAQSGVKNPGCNLSVTTLLMASGCAFVCGLLR